MVKILLIEDDELVRENVLELLDAEGFKTFCAANGLLGKEIAQQQVPDLILCDVMMPELDGYGVLQAVRQNPDTMTIPFIFLTAKAAKGDFRTGMQLGADDYLTKPFTRAELLGAVQTQLQKQQRYQKQIERAKQALDYQIRHDTLTGLPNRMSLREKFQDIITSATVHGDNQETVAIICLYLDQFNLIKETLGAAYSNLLLQAVAKRLQELACEGCLVAYLSDNKFALILANTHNQQETMIQAQVILKAVHQSFLLSDKEVFVTASLGIALYPLHGDDLESLLICADRALDYARQQGGNRYEFDAPMLQTVASERLALETSLRYALERDELAVYYQPRVSLKTGAIVGAEALLRWFSPEQGTVSPVRFIPIAEETGLIVPIGEWVLRQACERTKGWNQRLAEPIAIAVNLSSRQFSGTDIRQSLVGILQETQFNPQYLELELTESILVQDPTAAKQKLEELRKLGVTIAIDDFGTGYSSLSYLQQFPFEILKIDQCFVRNLAHDDKNAAITNAILQIAHSLNLRVIAEGVETQSELDFLHQHLCDEIQGYFFSHPLPAEEFTQLLNSGKYLPL